MHNPILTAIEKYMPALISMGLVILIGYMLAKLTWHFLAPDEVVSSTVAPVVPAHIVAQSGSTRKNYGDEVAEQHLFGRPPKKEAAPVRPVNPKPVARPAVKLKIKLHGVVASSGNDSFAIISGNGCRGQQVFGVSEDILCGTDNKIDESKDVKLIEVHPRKIVVDNNGNRETFSLPEVPELDLGINAGSIEPGNAGQGGQALAAQNPVAAPRHVVSQGGLPLLNDANAKRNTSVNNVSFTGAGNSSGGVGRSEAGANKKGVSPGQLVELREAIIQNPNKILEVVSISEAKDKEGNFLGFRLSPGNNRAVFRGLGLRAGDIARSVNGITLDSPLKALEVQSQLSVASSISITVLRGGQEFTITRDLPN